MKISSLIYTLALGAFVSSVAVHADEIGLNGASTAGMTWANAAWSPQAPLATDNVTLNLTDAINALLVNSNASAARLTLNNYSYMLVSGTGVTFASASDDVVLNGNSKIEVKNGAVLSVVSGKSFQIKGNASLLVDASTIIGQFYSNANATIQNNSTWKVSTSTGYAGTVTVKDSTVELTGDYKVSAGSTGTLILDNSTMGPSSGTNGINFGGTTNIINGSTIKNISHLNVGRESGSASGNTTVTMRGASAEKLSTFSNVQNIWLNVNSGGTSQFILDGNTSLPSTSKIDINKSNGGNFYIAFQNDNNTFETGTLRFGSLSDGTSYQAASGEWKLYTAAGATNNIFTLTNTATNVSSILQTSTLAGHSVKVGIDWGGGATNVFTAKNVLHLRGTTAANTTSDMYVTVRDGAKMVLTIVNVGGNDAATSASSGKTSLNVLDGGKLQADKVFINNSYVVNNSATGAGTALAKFTVSNSTIDNTTGNKVGPIVIGGVGGGLQNEGSTSVNSGTSVFEVINGADVTMSSNIDLITSNSASSTSVSKLLIDSSTLTMTSGEIRIAHDSGTGKVFAGGDAIIEVTGTGAVLDSQAKTIYSGNNVSVTGGSAQILLSGTGNKIKLGTTSDTVAFKMFSHSGTIQTGGSFDVKITGVNNSFETNGIVMGSNSSTGGSNSIYIKGDSATQKNKLTFVKGAYINVNGSTVADSQIENSITMAGNSLMDYTSTSIPVIEIASAASAGGKASVNIIGENNEIKGYRLLIGNNASTGGEAIMRIEGSTHKLNFVENFRLAGGAGTSTSNTIGGRLEMVFDDVGISSINVAGVTEFSGILLLDFNNLEGTFNEKEFTLITATNNWESTFNTWKAKNLLDLELRDASDIATLVYDQLTNSLKVIYTSTVPEPSTYAAILGAMALAIAVYKRRKN